MIKRDKYDLYLRIKNNTGASVNLNLLDKSALPGFFNSTRKFSYDITSQVYTGVQYIQIEVKINSASVYQTYQAPVQDLSPDGIIAALNSLGAGTFFKRLAGSTVFIETYNDNYTYGTLTIAPSATTSETNYVNYTTVAGGNLTIQVGVNPPLVVANNTYPSASNPGTFDVPQGSNVSVTATASIAEAADLLITQRLAFAPFTETTLYFVNVPGGGTTGFAFMSDPNYKYFVTFGTAP